MRPRSIVGLVDHVPGALAGVMRSDSILARATRPFLNRVVPAEETVVTIRAGAAKSLRLPIMPRTEKYYWTGTHESHVQDALAALLKPGMRFWDIGAHIGFFTLIAARLVGDSGKVMSFEPMPDTRIRLERTIALNGLRTVTVCDFALDNANGVRTLRPPMFVTADAGSLDEREGSPMWSLVTGQNPAVGVPVECRRLDDVVRPPETPDLLKIDAEGGEIDVLAGGMEFLNTCRPALIVEMSDEEKLRQGRLLLPQYRFEHLGKNHWLLS